MEVDLTDQTVPKLADVDVDMGDTDLPPLEAARAADGTRSKLTAAPPPIPMRAKRSNTLPPPIPSRAARGTVAPRITKVGVVEPSATPEMMAAWQINPEGPLRPSGTITAIPPPIAVKAPATALPTTIELVRAPDVAALDRAPDQRLTGNAPSIATRSATALPVVQRELIPSPRESRVTQLPTSQPGADVADLPVWPIAPAAKTMGEVLASRASSSKLPAPARGRNTLPPPIPGSPAPTAELRAPNVPTLAAPSLQVAPEVVANNVTALDGSDGWVFEDDDEERHVDGEVVPTTYFERLEAPQRRSVAKYLIAAGAAAAAIAVIAALAMQGASSTPVAVKPAPVDTAATMPAVAAVPTPTPVAVTPPVLTTLPITSSPVGATVTLVDNGNATVLGRTPVSAALDPSHSYDVALAVVGRPTVVTHVDFATMHELAIDLAPEQLATKPTKHEAAALAPRVMHHAITVPGPQLATPDFDASTAPVHHHHQAPVVAAAPTKQVAMAETTGVLMVSAKPPCEIVIDGKPTKLTTPQRSIALAPGAHAVTLINATIGIRKTIAIKVDAKKPTKLIQDFTKS